MAHVTAINSFVNFCLCSALEQHKDAYQAILNGVKGGPKEKRLAAQFIPKFFSSFPELADAAINAQLDLCEDEDVSVSILTQQYQINNSIGVLHVVCLIISFISGFDSGLHGLFK